MKSRIAEKEFRATVQASLDAIAAAKEDALPGKIAEACSLLEPYADSLTHLTVEQQQKLAELVKALCNLDDGPNARTKAIELLDKMKTFAAQF
jgi:hypothetical protein